MVFTFPAQAHDGTVPLTFWADNFESAEARCQTEIGASASNCTLRTWAIRRKCLLAQLDGGSCDEKADDQAVEDLQAAVFRGDLDSLCSAADVSKLLFTDIPDILLDVVNLCRELDSSAVSVVFNPLFAVGSTASLSEGDKDCIRAFASITTKAFHFGFRSRNGTLDNIAKRHRSSSAKSVDVEQTERRITRVDRSLRDALEARCDNATFESLYGFSTEQAVDLVSSRSACLAAAMYPARAYDCPEPVCGNGMRETNERCDDGNKKSGDGCSATCQIEL